MSMDRRNFLKTVGVAGLTLLVTDVFGKSESNNRDKTEFKGILYDSTLCVGCRTCETVCAETHKLPAPEVEIQIGNKRYTDDKHRTVINGYKTSKGEVFVKNQCMHCNEPACAAACLTKAMYKTKEGPVIWRSDKCMGCRYCMISCPFDIPKFEYLSSNPKIQKCNMCFERLTKGQLPACVENCPAEALKFGTRRDLIKEARKRIVENPGKYYDEIYGEKTAGGTAFLYLSPVPFNELGLKNKLQESSYPELSKSFLYSVPAVFVMLPPLLLGIYEASKNNIKSESNENQ